MHDTWWNPRLHSGICGGILLVLATCMGTGHSQPHSAIAGEPTPVKITDPLPYGGKPIDYHGSQTDDPLTRLIKQWTLKQPSQTPDGLPSLLKSLEISADSQLLIFSKTAVNAELIGPRTPRAVYFNDESYVAHVPGAATLEIISLDPHKGAIFYTAGRHSDDKLRFQRETRCLGCHVADATLQVPGPMLRSFRTDREGKPISGYPQITHATPYKKRWGGWYVTGAPGELPHLGNRFGKTTVDQSPPPKEPDLKLLAGEGIILNPHSDVVVHLVLTHQVHGQNLLIRAGQEAHTNRRSDAEDRLLRYLLFIDEPPLPAPLDASSEFARWFQRQGPRDSRGRSLRRFNLKTRLFEYRLSYLIYGRLFNELPTEVKGRLYRRLWEILTGKNQSLEFQKIPQAERAAVLDILRETKNNLPDYWNEPAGSVP